MKPADNRGSRFLVAAGMGSVIMISGSSAVGAGFWVTVALILSWAAGAWAALYWRID